ncbi:MAG: hypothetical protein VXZ82_25450 [Planctomycetota bacterium]|nr:hypothetical protein [Planctomycetota bacterium]
MSTRPYSPQAANTIVMVVCVGFPLFLCVPVLIQNWQLRKRAHERMGEFQPIEAKLSRSGVSVG